MPEVLTAMPTRIEAAAADVADTGKAHQLALETRDRLIRQAVDSGEMSQRAVARAAGFKGVAGVCRILAKPTE